MSFEARFYEREERLSFFVLFSRTSNAKSSAKSGVRNPSDEHNKVLSPISADHVVKEFREPVPQFHTVDKEMTVELTHAFVRREKTCSPTI